MSQQNFRQYLLNRIEEAYIHNAEKLNVWTGIRGNTIIGPYTPKCYLTQLLEQAILPEIVAAIKIDPFDYTIPQDGSLHTGKCQDNEFHGTWIEHI